MNPPQIDDYLSARWLRYLGAIKTFAARSQFYAAFPQFVMIATLFYYQSDLVQSFFPTIWGWVAFLAVIGVGTVIWEYTVMFPSQITFNAGQNSRENRNPLFKEVMKLHRRLDEIEPQLTDGSTTVVPECDNCDRAGTPAQHKGADVIACPNCGDILFRGLAS